MQALQSARCNALPPVYPPDNLDLFWDKGFGINGQVAGNEDGYYGNTLYMMADGAYGSGQTCSGAGTTAVWNNTIWSPTGNIQGACGGPQATPACRKAHASPAPAPPARLPAVQSAACPSLPGRRRAATRAPPPRRSPRTPSSSPLHAPSSASRARRVACATSGAAGIEFRTVST